MKINDEHGKCLENGIYKMYTSSSSVSIIGFSSADQVNVGWEVL